MQLILSLIFICIVGGWIKPDASTKMTNKNKSGFMMSKANILFIIAKEWLLNIYCATVPGVPPVPVAH
jgi:hypothetical protein